ncbi:MAG: 50S ribosomal protein L25 [Bacteroidales bacterium]|jgi:large subunit ribosomal protein L25|nr:50S ribosomal protein L25 [Bacteroidales bacterium]MBR4817226.1 50S ribosomal protein L25 [Bacteroidales bacterium]MBR5054313.1 50S ribosomal protein L25 [Bacteroidales bacterium]MBR5072284.1 50S ribosomal protein L25 [Bacteroidales bacterium]
MQHFELKGQVRQVGNKAVVKAYRKQGVVPCNLYGLGMENILFTVDEKELKALTNTPKSYIVDLKLDNGKSYNAVLHELQFHPVSERCLHVDFLAVNEEKPIAIKVPVIITGHSIGVQQGGKFTQNSRFIRISALMKDLPDDVTVDISSLALDKKIKAGDLKFDKISVISDKDTIICGVKSTRNMVAQETAE